jgi:hypothetical protein
VGTTFTRSLPAAIDEVLAVPRAVFALVPERLLRRHRCFPVSVEAAPAGRLALAMANPGDLAAADEVSFATGLRVVPIPATHAVVARMIALHLGGAVEQAAEADAIDLPEDVTGAHLKPEEWLEVTATQGKWR